MGIEIHRRLVDLLATGRLTEANEEPRKAHREPKGEIDMIHVIATIELVPGAREAYLAVFRKLIADVRAEPGCIEYGPAIDAETDLTNQAKVGPDKVVVVEKWEDLAALKAHSVTQHMQAYRINVKDFVIGVNLLVLDPAE